MLTPPVESVTDLRTGRFGGSDELQAGIALEDGLAEVDLTLCPGVPFRLMLEHPDFPVTLVHDGETLELAADWALHRGRNLRYVAETGALTDLRVFTDVGLIEIFANGGHCCGTRRIASDIPVSAVRLEGEGAIIQADIWHLRPQRGAISS